VKIIDLILLKIVLLIFLCSEIAIGRQINSSRSTFKNYLVNVLHKKNLPKKRHFYVIVDAENCEGCVSYLARVIKKRIGNNKNVTIVLSYHSKNAPDAVHEIVKDTNVIYDSEGNFMKIDGALGAIIQTKKLEITSIKDINRDNADKYITDITAK
jgi:hypothetical protein